MTSSSATPTTPTTNTDATDPDKRHRPLVSGIAISTGRTDSTGVITALIRGCTLTGLATRVADNQKVLVTNRHCIDRAFRNPKGDEDLYQGDLSVPLAIADKVGSNPEYVTALDQPAVNEVDAAYFELVADEPNGVDAAFNLFQTSATTPADRKIIAGEVVLKRDMMLTMIGRKGGEGQVRVRRFNADYESDNLLYKNAVILDCSQRPAIPGDSGAGLFYEVETGVYQLAGIFFSGPTGVPQADRGAAFPSKTAEEKLGIVFGNRLPVADAGPAQCVRAGNFVTLDPGGSYDDDGDALTFEWEQLDVEEDERLTLSIVTNLDGRRTFTAPAGPVTLSFRVTVTDTHGGVSTSTTTVDVSANPPNVNAGDDQSTNAGYPVSLRAADTNIRRGLRWQWEQLPGGTRVELNHPDSRYSWFTAPGGASTLKFRATATDRQGAKDADDVTVVIQNRAPTTGGSGNQTVSRGAIVALAARASDPEPDDIPKLNKLWTQESGPTVELTDADTQYATFTAPNSAATLRFLFTVTDPHGLTATYTETVMVR